MKHQSNIFDRGGGALSSSLDSKHAVEAITNFRFSE